VGRRCSLLVMREESDEGTRCRVQDVLAPKMGKRAAPAPEPPAADAGTCSECPADVSYFTAQGVGYCDSHGPKAATVAVE
jgi:hypothetical protein